LPNPGGLLRYMKMLRLERDAASIKSSVPIHRELDAEDHIGSPFS
jgi:hypothetical protein